MKTAQPITRAFFIADILCIVGACLIGRKPQERDPSTAQHELTLGMLAPMTGPGARFGESQRNGVQLAIDEINVPFAANKSANEQGRQGCANEGNSLRATVRMTGVHRTTIQKLLVELGGACSAYQDKVFHGLKCRRLQCDEVWQYCYSKQKNVPAQHRGEFGYGDVWTWTAIDAETKLVPCWYLGRRDANAAYHFMRDLAGRLASRCQLTTDGLRAYIEAVEDAFGSEIDYAQLVKLYGNEPTNGEVRYSPAVCMGARRAVVSGRPERRHISTSFFERQNLTMRMSMRRFTRLTNGFSKKVQNLEAAVALHFMYYNFARIHQTLRCTPAMEAGVSDHVWTIEEIVRLLD